MNFIGRTQELKKLSKVINNDSQQFALIYGRRRVGKSELVKQALKQCDAKAVYYECKQVSEASNTASLGDILSETMNLPKLGYTSIEALLKYIFELSEQEKIVLVLDEYPYLKRDVKGMDSILQALLDTYKDRSHLTLIILGSFVETMKSLLEHKNPLYGRADLTIDLKQMDYYESAAFYPDFSDEDKVRIYAVFGGIPYYNRLIDDSMSVKDNIIELIAAPGARLENEVAMYLNAEISKITNANEVFEALAAGFTRYSDILSQSHVSSGPTLVDVLDKLIKMELVGKVTPINDPGNKKKAAYVIVDNFSQFYYRFIFKFSSQMKIMDPGVFYDKYIAADLDAAYVPRRFEDICRQYLIRQNKAGNIDPVMEKMGKYYYDDPINHTNGEFDIVTEDERGYAFYEVKFKKDPVTEQDIQTEIEQVKRTGLNCCKYAFISRSGFAGKKIDGVEYIELKSLYL